MQFTLPVSILALLSLTSALPQPNNPSSSSSISLSQPPSALHRRQDPAPTAGPIPIQDPVKGWPASESVTRNWKGGGLTLSVDEMTSCLTTFSTDQWYDSLDGMECKGFGWFKGGNLGGKECYEVCATYLLYDGIKGSAKDYQCDFRKGTKGHCWMGYHPL